MLIKGKFSFKGEVDKENLGSLYAPIVQRPRMLPSHGSDPSSNLGGSILKYNFYLPFPITIPITTKIPTRIVTPKSMKK